jgi:hypothetical protein
MLRLIAAGGDRPNVAGPIPARNLQWILPYSPDVATAIASEKLRDSLRLTND